MLLHWQVATRPKKYDTDCHEDSRLQVRAFSWNGGTHFYYLEQSTALQPYVPIRTTLRSGSPEKRRTLTVHQIQWLTSDSESLCRRASSDDLRLRRSRTRGCPLRLPRHARKNTDADTASSDSVDRAFTALPHHPFRRFLRFRRLRGHGGHLQRTGLASTTSRRAAEG